MFRFDPSNNRPELPAELDAYILQFVGLFNHDTANAARVCRHANYAIKLLQTKKDLEATLITMSVPELVKAAVNSLDVAISLVENEKLLMSLGKYNEFALGVYYHLKDKNEHQLNLISGKYLAQLAAAHPIICEYLLTFHKKSLRPESIALLMGKETKNHTMPGC